MERAPEGEFPCGAVPETAEEHDEEEIEVGASVAFAIPAKRDVEVITQPRRKGQVPTFPELGDVRRRVSRLPHGDPGD